MSAEDKKLTRELNKQKQKFITDELINFINHKLDEETYHLNETSFFIPTLNANDEEVYYKIVISQVTKNFDELYDKNVTYKSKLKE